MYTRKVALSFAAAVATVPLVACGSSADARPAVPSAGAAAMPVIHSRPAAFDQAAEHAAPPVRQPRRGPVLELGWAGGYHALVDADGRAVYRFMPDRRGMSVCYGACAREWPPVYGRGHAAFGVHARNLGMTMRRDGWYQVTYHGHPLYYYAGDRRPGQARGQGMDGIWYLVDAYGNAIGGGRRPIR
jgi:predicted lipoprotein with Yx(FWY)xxD motif